MLHSTLDSEVEITPISNGGCLICFVCRLKTKRRIFYPPFLDTCAEEDGGQIETWGIHRDTGVRQDNGSIYVASLKQVSHPCSYSPKQNGQSREDD